MKKILIQILFVCLLMEVSGQTFKTSAERLESWKDARFGMFIHWGPVSLKGTEIGWSRGDKIPVEEYDNLYKQFNPVKFNAEEWVKLAKDAGMKYIVFTSKHHDGFCMWNTKYTDYNIMNSPFKRDVMKELADACKKYGMALGFYHSTCDWHHPDFPLTSPGGRVKRETPNIDRYTEYLKNESVEIIQNYGPLMVMWYDVPQEFDAKRGQGVIDAIRKVQPDILVNNRTGAKGDFDTPEQRIGGFQNDRPWETCMTIAQQWAWKPNDIVKSNEQCLNSLIRSAGGDGNLLFNVGPMPDGCIEPLQIERLKEMGKWLKKYGYTIYGTRGGPFKPTDWGVSTRKGNKIYLHILNWEGSNSLKLILPDLGMKILKCSLVDGGKVKYRQNQHEIIVEFDRKFLRPVNTIVEIELAGNAMDIQPMDVSPQSLSFMKPANASSHPRPSWTNHQWIDIKYLTDEDWVCDFWHPSKNDLKPWIAINLGLPQKVKEAIIYERGEQIKTYELQYKSGEEWKTFFKGEKIGSKADVAFPEVQAQWFRLLIQEFSGAPEIYEIVLL